MIQLAILKAIEAKLKTITLNNGYLTNIGQNTVKYWHDLDFEYDKEALEYRDIVEETEQPNQQTENTLTVKISYFSPTENPLTLGCQVLSDLKKACYKETWEKNALNTKISSSNKLVETKGKTILKVCLIIQVKYREII